MQKNPETIKLQIPKLKVAGSNPVSRSKFFEGFGTCRSLPGITSVCRRFLMISPL